MNLQKKTFRSGMAVTLSAMTIQVIQLVSTVILARLLDPSDFGVISLIVVVMGTTNIFSGMGMSAALIATNEDVSKAGFHAFVITACTGSFLTLLVVLLAPEFARFLGGEEWVLVYRWMAVVILMNTLFIVPNAILEREMLFGRRIIPRTAGAFSNMVVAIGMAYTGWGVWSLAMAQIVGSFITLMATIAVCPTLQWLRPQRWDRVLAHGLTRYGLTNMSTGIVQYVYDNGDDIVVGKVHGAAALGFYSKAYMLSNLPVSNISRVVNSVLLPAYVKVREDSSLLARSYLKSLQMVSVLTLPVAMGLLVLAPDFILLVLGEKWRAATPILQVFAVMSLLRPLSGTTSPLFHALRRPNFNFRTAVLQGVSMLILIPLFVRWGAVGVAFAVVISFALGFLHNMYLSCYRSDLPLKPQNVLGQLWPVSLATLIMTAVVVALKHSLLQSAGGFHIHTALSWMTLVLIGMLSYTLSLLLIKRRLVFEILELVVSSTGLPINGKWFRSRDRTQSPREIMRDVIRSLRRRSVRLLPWRGNVRQDVREGYPEGLVGEEVERLATTYLRNEVARVSHTHISSWKKAGAFRVFLRDRSQRSWSLIYKNSLYAEGDIVALRGLPIVPGPPEYIVYSLADGALGDYLPEVYRVKEVVASRHYQYLMEDLRSEYTTSLGKKAVLRLCAKLPAIHEAMSTALRSEVHDQLLCFDRVFSQRLLDYAKASLQNLAATTPTSRLHTTLALWEPLTQVYCRVMDHIYAEDVIGPIHGDLNLSNVLYHRTDCDRIKLLDWEWAGFGVSYADLASLLKRVPPDVESKGLAVYQDNYKRQVSMDVQHIYQWCKLQRGIFDASFFAQEQAGAEGQPKHNLDGHIDRALGRAQESFIELSKNY